MHTGASKELSISLRIHLLAESLNSLASNPAACLCLRRATAMITEREQADGRYLLSSRFAHTAGWRAVRTFADNTQCAGVSPCVPFEDWPVDVWAAILLKLQP